MQKPYSQACENNKLPIFSTLQPILNTLKSVVEIGSGTGQHAVHVARLHPQLQWQCCDQAEYLPGIQQWLDEAKLDNLPALQDGEVFPRALITATDFDRGFVVLERIGERHLKPRLVDLRDVKELKPDWS